MLHLIEPGLGAVPDAFSSRLPFADGVATRGRTSGHQQVQRRSNLFAVARRHLAQEGHKKVTLRALATECDITVQTIFNLVGDRQHVLGGAIADHGAILAETACGGRLFPIGILALADALWLSAVRNPEYMREASLCYNSSPTYSQGTIKAAATAYVRAALNDVRGELRSTVPFHLFVHTVQSAIADTFRQWAERSVELSELHLNLTTSCALLLIGAVESQSNIRVRADKWLEQQRVFS